LFKSSLPQPLQTHPAHLSSPRTGPVKVLAAFSGLMSPSNAVLKNPVVSYSPQTTSEALGGAWNKVGSSQTSSTRNKRGGSLAEQAAQQHLQLGMQTVFHHSFVGKINQLLNTNKDGGLERDGTLSRGDVISPLNSSHHKNSAGIGGLGRGRLNLVFGEKMRMVAKSLERVGSSQHHFVSNHWKRSKIQGLSTQHEFAREKLKQKIEAISYTLSVSLNYYQEGTEQLR
jgi:hypothetical protein